MEERHLDDEVLMAIAEDASYTAQKSELRHLARCYDCRGRAARYARMLDGVRYVSGQKDYNEDWMLRQAEDPSAPVGAGDRYQILHFQHQHLSYVASTGGADADKVMQTRRQAEDGWMSKLKRIFASTGAGYGGLKFAGMVAGMAAVAGVLLLMPRERGSTSASLAFYDDSPRWEMTQPAQPGLGFFATATHTYQDFGKVSIAWNENTLSVDWPNIPGARRYAFDLLAMEDGQEVSRHHSEVSLPTVKIDALNLQAQTRYIWRISGDTADQQKFLRQGGFVVAAGR